MASSSIAYIDPQISGACSPIFFSSRLLVIETSHLDERVELDIDFIKATIKIQGTPFTIFCGTQPTVRVRVEPQLANFAQITAL